MSAPRARPPGDGAAGSASTLTTERYPILEYDSDRSALIEPSVHLAAPSRDEVDVPDRAVACFFGDVVARMAIELGATEVAHLHSEHGVHAIWEVERGGRRVAFFQPGVGAPLAALFVEEAIDYGCRTIVACGGAGALHGGLALGHPVVVTGAVRDEGTSYHYLPPARVVDTDPAVVASLRRTLALAGVEHAAGLTWSTDAVYRETRARVRRRAAEGCLTVEMEAAALLALAQFRSVAFGQLLYAADSLAGDDWDHRSWTEAHDAREALFLLALDAVVALPDRGQGA